MAPVTTADRADRPLAAGEAICESAALRDGGPGVRFRVRWRGLPAPAFAVRHAGQARAYLNRCAHRAVELDWIEGEFFAATGSELICATHGARYHPATGTCLGGPCAGLGLVALPVLERGGRLLLGRHRDLDDGAVAPGAE
jgi:nitrite reductase/ring-hydroxylating ferredoxin subunit